MKLFEQCPRKYFHLRVVKDVVEPESEAMHYGTRFHEAAEFYIRDDKPLPHEFHYAKASLDRLKAFPGEKLCEYEMGLTENLEPCGFKDPNVWWRGIADLIILRDDVAFVLDYKTGKSAKYADPDQLELMSLCVFKHFPEIKKVKAGLLFVVANAFPKAQFDIKDEVKWDKWKLKHSRLQAAHDNDVWNPKPSGLCKAWCPVLSCSHNGRA